MRKCACANANFRHATTTALYVHNATTSNKVEDCIFWYKAKPIPPEFRIGCEDYWDFHNERYNPDIENF